jgi:hypothetical protein
MSCSRHIGLLARRAHGQQSRHKPEPLVQLPCRAAESVRRRAISARTVASGVPVDRYTSDCGRGLEPNGARARPARGRSNKAQLIEARRARRHSARVAWRSERPFEQRKTVIAADPRAASIESPVGRTEASASACFRQRPAPNCRLSQIDGTPLRERARASQTLTDRQRAARGIDL